MARLMTWRQIRAEKIYRARTWIKKRVANGEFPPPVVQGQGRAGDLWNEEDVDRWLPEFIEQAKKASGERPVGKRRVEAATQAKKRSTSGEPVKAGRRAV